MIDCIMDGLIDTIKIMPYLLIAFILLEIIMSLMFAFTVVTGGEVLSEYGTIFFNAVVVFLPIGLSVYAVNNKSVLLEKFYECSFALEILLIVTLLTTKNGNYQMPVGYALAFQMLIVLDRFFLKRKWYDLLIAIIDFLVIFVFGSRGPTLCFLTMIILNIIFSNVLNKRKKIGVATITIIIGFFIYLNYAQVLMSISRLAAIIGYSSRNIQSIFSKVFLGDSGRSSYYNLYLNKIRLNPIIGYGLGGGWKSVGEYPHNLFIEILLYFGVVFGSAFCLLVLRLSRKAIGSTEVHTQRLSFIMSSYCVSLMVSDSFIQCPMFYILMLLGLNMVPIHIRLSLKTD